MCSICDGMTEDEVRARRARTIEENGWSLVGVEASPASRGWHYTIGLVENFDHPELVVASALDAEMEVALLVHLVSMVEDGRYLGAGEGVMVGRTEIRLAPLHPRQIEHGVVNMWLDHYRAFPEYLEQLEALQVVLPSRFFNERTGPQPRLDRPDEALATRFANRRLRREAARPAARRRPPNRRR